MTSVYGSMLSPEWAIGHEGGASGARCAVWLCRRLACSCAFSVPTVRLVLVVGWYGWLGAVSEQNFLGEFIGFTIAFGSVFMAFMVWIRGLGTASTSSRLLPHLVWLVGLSGRGRFSYSCVICVFGVGVCSFMY